MIPQRFFFEFDPCTPPAPGYPLFCPEPPRPPPLETHFFEVLRGVGGGSKIDGVENHESFGFFFDFQPKKCFQVPTPWGLYGVEEHYCNLCTFQPFLLCWWFWQPW